MMRLHSATLPVGLVLVISATTPGQTLTRSRSGEPTIGQMRCAAPTRVTTAVRKFLDLRVSGEENRARTTRLVQQLNWHQSLATALRAGRKSGRPIVYIHALCDINGLC